MRRFLGSVVAVAIWLSLVASAPAAPGLASRLAGYWRCDNGTRISYVPLEDGAGPQRVAARVTAADGSVYLESDAIDGTRSEVSLYPQVPSMTGSANGDGFRASGTAPDGSVAIASVGFDGALLTHDVTLGSDVVRSRCTREPDRAYPTTCAQPNAPAATVHAAEPDMPANAISQHIEGRVNVAIFLDDRSEVVQAKVVRSSSAALNESAVKAAVLSTYRTATRNCSPVPGLYIFSVDYTNRRF